jgi:hypothetical protein
LESLPQISASFERGEISYSKVRAMTRVATAANEPALLNVALHGTASHIERLVRKYRWCERRDAAQVANAQHEQRQLHYFFEDSGELVLQARLPPDVGAIVVKALQLATELPQPVSACMDSSSVARGLTSGGRFDCSRVSGLCVVPKARDHDGLFAR